MSQVFTDKDVAKDIEAVCSKCGESWHVIVAVANGQIAKVECKSCGGAHKYRPVGANRTTLKKSTKSAVVDASAPAATKPTASKASKASKSSKSSSNASPKLLVPKVNANNREIRKYGIKETGFRLGDRIEHTKFGLGIVDEFPSPNKMYVTFETERILLVYGK